MTILLKFILFSLIFFNIQMTSAKEKVLSNPELIANEFLDGNSKSFEEILNSSPDYKYKNLMQLISSGDSPELIAKTLEEFNHNIPTNIRFMEAIISAAEKDPEFVKRASSSLKELKPMLSMTRGTALVPNHCLLFIGAYFSARDIAYSSRSFFHPGTKADKEFISKMDKLMTVSEYLTPMACIFDIATRRHEYKQFISNISDYKRSRSNIKSLKKIVEEIKIKPEQVKNAVLKKNILKMSELERERLGRLVLDGLNKNTETKIQSDLSILEKFKLFLENKKNKELIGKYTQMLKKGNYEEISSIMEEDFLKELVKNESGTYRELKLKLSEARKSELKNQKAFDIPTSTKLCFAAIGSTVLMQGHIAAIGPNQTIFDNTEDEWLRDNRRNLAYLGLAAIVPTCFLKAPYFIYLMKTNQLNDAIKLRQLDYQAMERSLERAHERFVNGEKVNLKGSAKSSASNIIAKTEKKILGILGEKNEVAGENVSKSILKILDDLKMGEKSLTKTLIESLKQNDLKLFSELLGSSDPKEFQNLVNLLGNGDSISAGELIKDIKHNKFDMIKYLFELQKEVKGNPDALSKIEQNLLSLKKEMKIQNIKTPGAQACLIALGTYIGTRDLFFSIKNSYIEKELDYAWADAMDAADALTGLGITYFCLSDFIVHGKGYKEYFKAIGNLRADKKNIQTLIDLTTSYKESPQLKKVIGRLKFIPSLNKDRVLGIATKIAERIDETRPVKFKNLNEAWKEFLFSNKMDSLLKEYQMTLSPEEKIKLNLVINKGAVDVLDQEKALVLIDDFKLYLTENFEDWLKNADKAEREALFLELRKLKQSQKETKIKHKSPGLGTKACFWGVGTILAGLGYHAAVGDKENELDHRFEVEQRKKTHEYFLGAQAIFAGTCGLNIFYAGREKMKKTNELRQKPFLSNNDSDWLMIESVLEEYDSKVKVTKVKGKAQRAKDILLNISNRQYYLNNGVNPKIKTLKGARKLKDKINRSTSDQFYFNFDKKCLENSLKSFF
jgi:hypothetical protein